MSVLVSIIITTRNEEANIGDCLEAIKKQFFPKDKIEIIVVDNNSSDRTMGIAFRYTDKVYNFGPERSAQRNFGAGKASGKYLLFLDADMSLSRRVVSKCVERCEKEEDVALYIPERISGAGFWISVRDFERSFYNATCIDCVRFIRNDIFLKIKGFDENLTGPEDWDLDRRILECGKTGIIDVPLYHNEGVFNLKDYLRGKGYYYGNLPAYIYKWGRKDKLIRKQLGIWYRYLGVFLESGKWKELIMHPLLAGGMFFLRILVGVGYLKSIIAKEGRGRPG